MIVFLVTREHTYTVDRFVKYWAGWFRWRMKVLPYDRIPPREALPAAAFIFTDLDRLTDAQREEAADLRDWLADHRPESRLLNHPREAKLRFELLRTLRAEGVNDFGAYRLGEPREDLRFPVFVRPARQHEGSYTRLLYDHDTLDRAIDSLRAEGLGEEDLLVVEFVDTSGGAAMFRKYSAFSVAGRIIPRQLFFGREWQLKHPGLVDPEKVREEVEYLETNPHEEALERVFELARIDYGRIDYALLDGKVQVFEINTNPIVMSKKPKRYDPARLAAQAWFAERFLSAIRELADAGGARGLRDRARCFRLMLR